jgi:pimeloyl-ACP methyl ester carboxylesterase
VLDHGIVPSGMTTDVFLLPGLDGTGVMSEPIRDALSSALNPIVVSYPKDEVLDYAALASWLAPRFRTGGRFALVAESFSGPLALKLAAARPNGLTAVVLAATFLSCPIRFVPRVAAHLVGALAFRRAPSQFLLRRYFVGTDAPQEMVDKMRSATESVRPEVLAGRVRAIVRADARRDLLHCAAPLLYIRGERDRVVPAASMDAMRRLRPDLECVLLDAPHLVLQRQPEACAEAITTFVRRRLD